MAIALNASTLGTQAAPTGTFSHVVTGANTLLAVGVAMDNAGESVGTVTYNGVSLTAAGSSAENSSRRSWMFYLINPTTGTNNVIVKASSGASRVGVFISSWTGVDQTTGIEGSVFGTASNGTAAGTYTTINNNARLVAAWRGFDGAGAALTSNTYQGRVDQAFSSGHGAYYTNNISPAGLGTVGGTTSSGAWALAAIALKPFGGVGTNLIQSAGTSGLGLTSISASWPGATTTGNTVMVGVTITNAATLGTVTSVTDTQGNTYNKAVSQAGTAIKVVDTELWYATNITGGAGSVTVNLPINAVSVYVREYTGVYNALDRTSSAVGSSTAINSGTTATTTAANELLVLCTGDEQGGTQTYQSAGIFGDMVGTTTTATGVSMSDALVSSTGAQTGTQTMTVSDEWVSVLATFYQAAASGVTTGWRNLLGVGI